MIGMVRQFRINHLLNSKVILEERNHLPSALYVARHPQVQRLDALQDMEGGHRRHAGAEIARPLAAGAQQEGARARLFLEVHAVKALIRRGKELELAGSLPVEAPRV